MALRILIGWHKKKGIECLYIGENGVECQSVAEDAAKTEDYTRLGLSVSPSLIPVAIDPTPTMASGRPPARERKSAQLPKVADAPKHIDLKEAAERQRRARFGLQPLEEVKPGQAIKGGPTLEQYIKSGYSADNYPPQGYKPVDSPAYQDLLEKRKQEAAAALKAKEEEAKKKATEPSKVEGKDEETKN